MLAVAGLLLASGDETSQEELTSGREASLSAERPDVTWRKLPSVPRSAFTGPVGEPFVFGRRVVYAAPVDTRAQTARIATLDLRSQKPRWISAAQSGLRWRYGESILKADGNLIFWGGCCGPSDVGSRAEGAIYTVESNTWRTLPPSPLGNRFDHSAVWTGKEMIVWGGQGQNPARANVSNAEGAAYDPVTHQWRRLAPSPLGQRECHVAEWTGAEMIVLGGLPFGCGTGARAIWTNGAAYDPEKDRWRTIPRAPLAFKLNPEYQGPASHWTGREMIVSDGGTVAAFNPKASTWRRLPPLPRKASNDVEPGVLIETKHGLIASGGCCDDRGLSTTDAFLYQPDLDDWIRIPRAPNEKPTTFAANLGDRLLAQTGRARYIAEFR